MFKSLSFLLILSMLPSCGWLIVSGKDNSNQRQFDNQKNAERSFNGSTVQCEGESCAPFVGGLYTLSEDRLGVGACSFTLVSKNQVLTNAHCIPEDLLNERTLCAGRINLVFPKTEQDPFERVDCSYIKKLSARTSSDEVASPDWALIRMSRNVERRLPEISKQGLEADSPLSLYKVNFNLDIKTISTGVIQKTNCLANTNFFLSDHNLGRHSPLVDISHCDQKLIPGNSGSGYFNEDGQLVGIHSWGVLVEDSEKEWAQFYRERFSNIRQNFGGGTHAQCLPLGVSASSVVDCEFDEIGYKKLTTLFSKIKHQAGSSEEFEAARRQVLRENRHSGFEWTEREDVILSRLNLNFSGEEGLVKTRIFLKLLKSKFPLFPHCIHRASFVQNLSISHIERSTLPVERSSLRGRQGSDVVRDSLEITWQRSSSTMNGDLTHYFNEEELDSFDLGELPLNLAIPLCR